MNAALFWDDIAGRHMKHNVLLLLIPDSHLIFLCVTTTGINVVVGIAFMLHPPVLLFV